MSRIWGAAFLIVALSATAESRPADDDMVEQVGRSVETWNRQHRGAWSMSFAADREVGGLLYQWDQTLPACRECQLVAVQVTDIGGEAEVAWELAGDVAARGVTRLSVGAASRVARK